MSLGPAHAVLLRDAIRAHAAPADLIEAFDHATEDTLTPWYRDQVERDQRRAARMRAILEGRPPGPDSDPVLQLIAAGQTSWSPSPSGQRLCDDARPSRGGVAVATRQCPPPGRGGGH
jgi:hypothetical protein